jgi:hypothetical protein
VLFVEESDHASSGMLSEEMNSPPQRLQINLLAVHARLGVVISNDCIFYKRIATLPFFVRL